MYVDCLNCRYNKKYLNFRVVTGVRLVKKNRVFFIQIQEGELGTYGAIFNRNWVPVKDVNVTNRSFKNNIHYITLNSNRRSLNLTPRILKDNYVVTGRYY